MSSLYLDGGFKNNLFSAVPPLKTRLFLSCLIFLIYKVLWSFFRISQGVSLKKRLNVPFKSRKTPFWRNEEHDFAVKMLISQEI